MNPEALTHLFQEDLYCYAAPVTVVIPRAWESYAQDDQQLLKKILTSVKVDFNAVQIVLQPHVDLGQLRIYSPARVLVFGGEAVGDIPLYQATAAQGFMVVRAEELSTLDEQKKKNLWTALRQMFGL